MAVNKVVYGDTTLIDLSSDTVTPSNLLVGTTAHDAKGDLIIGTTSAGSTLTVTAPEGSTITVTGNGNTYTKIGGTVEFRNLADGTYTVMASLGEQISTQSVSIKSSYETELAYVRIYGIQRDITNPSPLWERTDDAVGVTEPTVSTGTIAGQSVFDDFYPWGAISRETLDTGDVMVKIPKFWFRRWREGNIEHIQIADNAADDFVVHPAFTHNGVESDFVYIAAYVADNTGVSCSGKSATFLGLRSACRSKATAKGTGWYMFDMACLSAVQMLIMVEFATNNAQEAIGLGVTTYNSALQATGKTDTVPNLTGKAAGTDGQVSIVWRGIENIWGNHPYHIDGICLLSKKWYISNTPNDYASNSAYSYIEWPYDTLTPAYIVEMGLAESLPHVMLPSSSDSGSNSTYYCDRFGGQNGSIIFGGYNGGRDAGLFYWNGSYYENYSQATAGLRLIKIP